MILVDDGSTDGSPAICDDYASRDDRVKVIHKANAGQAMAHNSGLEVASGSFLSFIDSDDFILQGMYEKLYSLIASEDADVSLCDFWPVDKAGNMMPKKWKNIPSETLSGEEVLHRFMDGINGSYQMIWHRLHKAEIFQDIRFPAGNKHDDVATAHRIFGASHKVATTDEIFYMYRQREDSVMGQLQNFGEGIDYRLDTLYLYSDRAKYFRSTGKIEWARQSQYAEFHTLKRALKDANYLQYRKELSPYLQEVMSSLLLSFGFRDKLRAAKLFLILLRSILRPFTDKEKNL